MKKFLNVFLFIIIIPFIIFGSLNSYWIPENNNTKYETNLNEVPNYGLERHLTDDLYDNTVWVNSMISKDAVGFNNQDIILSFDSGNNITENDNLKTVDLVDLTFIYTDMNGYTYMWKQDNPFLLYDGETGEFNDYSFINDFNETMYINEIWDPNMNIIPISEWENVPFWNLVQNPTIETWERINLSLVDRDETTGFLINYTSEFTPYNETQDIKIKNNMTLTYEFDLNTPEYATFNSFLYDMNIPDSLLNWYGGNPPPNTAGIVGLDREKTGQFYGQFNYHMTFYNQYNNEILTTSFIQNEYNAETINYSGYGKNNIFYAPDNLKTNDIAYITMNWDSGFYGNNGTDNDLYVEPYAFIYYNFAITEFNVFSTDPVVGLPDGGNVEYENCSWFDIFCVARNIFTWIFFGSFLYDIMEPILDPIYNLMNEMIIFIYSMFYTLGIFDPYLNTADEFVVNTVISIFILILILKFIGLFGG